MICFKFPGLYRLLGKWVSLARVGFKNWDTKGHTLSEETEWRKATIDPVFEESSRRRPYSAEEENLKPPKPLSSPSAVRSGPGLDVTPKRTQQGRILRHGALEGHRQSQTPTPREQPPAPHARPCPPTTCPAGLPLFPAPSLPPLPVYSLSEDVTLRTNYRPDLSLPFFLDHGFHLTLQDCGFPRRRAPHLRPRSRSGRPDPSFLAPGPYSFPSRVDVLSCTRNPDSNGVNNKTQFSTTTKSVCRLSPCRTSLHPRWAEYDCKLNSCGLETGIC